MPDDKNIVDAINQARGVSVLPHIEYRKMKALERIVELLEKLASPPKMIVPEGLEPEHLMPGPITYSRRRARPVVEKADDAAS